MRRRVGCVAFALLASVMAMSAWAQEVVTDGTNSYARFELRLPLGRGLEGRFPHMQAEWLPQYQASIDPARARLAEAERTGQRVRLHQTRGAARLEIKSVEAMAQEAAAARANAGAADKAQMTKTPTH